MGAFLLIAFGICLNENDSKNMKSYQKGYSIYILSCFLVYKEYRNNA